MKSIFLFFLALMAFAKVSAQSNVIPTYKKIQLIEYELTGNAKQPAIKITDAMQITGYTMHRLTKTYRGICDTTYQLEDKSIEILNSLFNSKRQLNNYQKTTKLAPGDHYGGYPSLLIYTDNAGRQQKLLVVEPLMDEDFMKVFDAMTKFPFPTTVKYNGDKVIDRQLEREVLNAHKIRNELPKTELPPDMAPPSVQ